MPRAKKKAQKKVPKKVQSKVQKKAQKKVPKKVQKKVRMITPVKRSFFQSNIFAALFVVVVVGVFISFADRFYETSVKNDAPSAEQQAVVAEKTTEITVKPQEKPIAPREPVRQEAAEIPFQTYFVNFEFLNIRESIGLNAPILKVLNRNNQLLAQPTDNPEWVKVILEDGTPGFAAKRYLTALTKDLATQRGLLDIPILMYHYVGTLPRDADELRKNLTVSPSQLWQHLQYLQQTGVKTITLEDLAIMKRDRAVLPEKAAILTFDDGYTDHYTNVFPQLKKLNQKAVFFVIIDRIGTPGFMTWDQIKEMREVGMEIGSHAKGDLDLRFVSEREAFNQIQDSKRILEETLETAVYSFAYPSGKYSTWLFRVLTRSGYAFARSTDGGRYLDIERHPYTLPVLRVMPTTDSAKLASWGI